MQTLGFMQEAQTAKATLVANRIDYWPNTALAVNYYWPYPSTVERIVVAPQSCSGDVHVFPCPHCNKCKCGKATKNKE